MQHLYPRQLHTGGSCLIPKQFFSVIKVCPNWHASLFEWTNCNADQYQLVWSIRAQSQLGCSVGTGKSFRPTAVEHSVWNLSVHVLRCLESEGTVSYGYVWIYTRQEHISRHRSAFPRMTYQGVGCAPSICTLAFTIPGYILFWPVMNEVIQVGPA